jgi:predicted transcriptional regulator
VKKKKANGNGSRVLVISLHPTHAQNILDGKKTVELRRRRPKVKSGDRIVIYAASPAKAFVGSFLVAEVFFDSPVRLWERVADRCGISRQQFDDYYLNSPHAVAIDVGKVTRFKPISLATIRKLLPEFHPPQAFLYLEEKKLRSLITPRRSSEN